jgi:hypothetical protein
MAEILSRRTPLSARKRWMANPCGEHLYRPDQHPLVQPMERSPSPSEARPLRPPLPPTCCSGSVAATYKERCIARRHDRHEKDGSMGVQAIKKWAGGDRQDQATSEFAGMPSASIATGAVDHILPLGKSPGALVELITVGFQMTDHNDHQNFTAPFT